jgi:8-oxo-dGTP pyrophosphatase MutT (NUDIX family)
MPEPDKEEIREILEARNPRRIEPGGLKLAAVLAPIFKKDGKWHVLLTRRTNRVEHHKGEISFPGGHKDPEDPDLEYTALRETEEEVGIPPDRVTILGRLDDMTTITGFRIRPYVGVIPHPFEYRPAPDEIAEIIELPLHRFLEPDQFIKDEFTRDNMPYPVYYFNIDGYMVWGATAKMLKQFLELAYGFEEPDQ